MIVRDVAWLPKPNMVEVIVTSELTPSELTPTAFVLPVFDNGDIMLACNRQRGLEIPGGHIDPGEDAETAAIREAVEEVGCCVEGLIPIGLMKSTCFGAAPEGYRYPFPVSYQQFFAGRVIGQVQCGDYECGEPHRTSQRDGFARPSIDLFAKRAREVMLQGG